MTQQFIKQPRIDVADVLRGLAVMGIIVLHAIEHFNFYSYPDTSTQSAWLNFSDRAIWDGLFLMFGGKAYAVFAPALWIQLLHPGQQPADAWQRFPLALLLAIGVTLHFG